jgi:hypothetical protein
MGKARGSIPEMDGFELGTPTLVCRWRLRDRRLPLANRHLRALAHRRIQGEVVSPEMVGWAKQHIEWTLDEGAVEHPDGVLMLVVDEQRRAAMAVGDFEPLPHASSRILASRAAESLVEAASTSVAPEALWLVEDGRLVAGIAPGTYPGGTTSLVLQLAETIGLPVRRDGEAAEEVLSGVADYDEAFLTSDEYGVVEARDAAGPVARRFVDAYAKLLESVKRKR